MTDIRDVPGSDVVGFIFSVFLFAAVINGAMLYRPSHVMASPIRAASWMKADKVQGRIPRVVQPITYKNPLLIPSTCVRLAAREGERLPGNEPEMFRAKARVLMLARRGDKLARECARDMEKT